MILFDAVWELIVMSSEQKPKVVSSGKQDKPMHKDLLCERTCDLNNAKSDLKEGQKNHYGCEATSN
jgi:hypothetical protein